ncbi:MAG: c-type cytochrome [Gemmatimonadetes bacterium]|nr:c-type cytochrome [Gemmatimonadota bacterium]
MRSTLTVAFLLLTGCGDSGPSSPQGGAPADTFPPRDTITITIEGLPPMNAAPGNPLTLQGIALGKRLFFDPLLSLDSTLSCAGCHKPEFAFGDSAIITPGVDGALGARNSPPIINAGWSDLLFWDGRGLSLEDQIVGPVMDVEEMNLPWDEAVARVQAHDEYPELFGRAFGSTRVTESRIRMAIAQFERTLISFESKYDKWKRFEVELTESERRGHDLFFSEQAECFHCHGVNDLLTDDDFHSIGLENPLVDRGRGAVTGNPLEDGLFKSPTLRNIGVTAPYMHDGRFATLDEVIEHYRSGGVRGPNVDALIPTGVGFDLSDQDVEDLIAFLHTLTDSSFLTNPAHRP